jgi:collagenase-like PrtC family protease
MELDTDTIAALASAIDRVLCGLTQVVSSREKPHFEDADRSELVQMLQQAARP